MASHLKVVKEVPAYRVFRTNKRFSLLLDNAGRIAAALESGPEEHLSGCGRVGH
jgi:hypothetical protein